MQEEGGGEVDSIVTYHSGGKTHNDELDVNIHPSYTDFQVL